MAAITKIRIDGFKAFPEELELALDGKNLLMYGENGSGKSSIYYALHALLQSQYHDKGFIYFDKNNPESLVNKYTTTADPYIEVELEGGDTKYHLSKDGYKELPAQAISPLRDMNAECVFINHKFLFNCFSFRNSQYIDLFPVFIKDILPFTFTNDRAKYISELYDKIVAGIQRKGQSKKIDPGYVDLIEKFNQEVLRIIQKINHKDDIDAPSSVSNIYNNHFRDSDDRELLIELNYENNKDKIPQPNKSYWLRYGYRYQQTSVAHVIQEERVGRVMEILPPVIRLTIKEKKEDGTWIDMEKPQTQLNEAKLTAIILSIRFSLLDLVAAPDGRFLALDDMLISLDMSNRSKVVDYLLEEVVNKYKIYLFTHDRAFYNFLCYKIRQQSSLETWTFKTISYNIKRKKPIIIDEYSDYLSKAKSFYDIGDYEIAAINLRKQLEQCIRMLLPYELATKADGNFIELENLWRKLVKFYSDNGQAIDHSTQKLFSDSKLLILNPAAHAQRLSMPIYRTELDNVFKLVNHILSLDRIDNKLIIEGGKRIEFNHPQKDYTCSFTLDSDLVVVANEHIVAKIPKCKNIKWSYNGVENWDFETDAQNNNHPLLKASPKLTKFFEGCCTIHPLDITHDMLMTHCKVDGIPLIDYFKGLDVLTIAIKA